VCRRLCTDRWAGSLALANARLKAPRLRSSVVGSPSSVQKTERGTSGQPFASVAFFWSTRSVAAPGRPGSTCLQGAHDRTSVCRDVHEKMARATRIPRSLVLARLDALCQLQLASKPRRWVSSNHTVHDDRAQETPEDGQHELDGASWCARLKLFNQPLPNLRAVDQTYLLPREGRRDVEPIVLLITFQGGGLHSHLNLANPPLTA
jgi:hypothetical protein